MDTTCAKCGASLNKFLSSFVDNKIGRSEQCPKCGTDLKSCIQCQFYDPGAYNECKEPQAERVVDKERANFCDYFKISSSPKNTEHHKKEKDDALKKLDDLFR